MADHMGLRIFEADPDAKPAPKAEKSEYARPAFQLRTGMSITDPDNPKKKKGISLPNWRVTTDDPDVARGISELFGGAPDEFDPSQKLNWHVLTETATLEVVIDGSAAVEDKLVQWGGVGGPVHECDGMYSLLPEDKGEPCGCPAELKQKKARAGKNRGPKPAINIDLFLVGAGEELGKGKLIATAWTLAEEIHEVKNALDAVGGPALCKLEINHVSYVSKIHGQVDYYHPVITVLGSYNDAIAEER